MPRLDLERGQDRMPDHHAPIVRSSRPCKVPSLVGAYDSPAVEAPPLHDVLTNDLAAREAFRTIRGVKVVHGPIIRQTG